MYHSHLHQILVDTLKGTIWTRSTKDEDNFRQVVCSSLYSYVSPNNVEIPSTRSGNGDIKIFGRKIELKYASSDKREGLGSFLEDFDLLLNSRIEFCIMAIKLDASKDDKYVHRCVHLPMLPQSGALGTFGNRSIAGSTYKSISVFLSATYPHASTKMKVRVGKGKNATAFLSFEAVTAIARSSFLETHMGVIHVDVIGSREDGLMCFLYKRADNVKLIDVPGGITGQFEIPNNPSPIVIGTTRMVNAVADSQKTVGAGRDAAYSNVQETNVLAIKI
jgi:hypothetical protein